MQYDLLERVVDDLAVQLSGCRIAKIHQPGADLLIFRLWDGRRNHKLLISAEADRSRIHLTEKEYPNPGTPPRFCQLLRARMKKLHSFSLVNEDRIVALRGAGPQGNCTLIAELFGPGSNLILVDENQQIIDALHRVQGDATARSIRAGEKYSAPAKPEIPIERRGEKSEENTDCQANLHAHVEKFYSSVRQVQGIKGLEGQLRKVIRRQLKKLKSRVGKINQEMERQADADFYRQCGELLLANLHSLKRGMTQATLSNLFVDPPQEINVELASNKTPQQNAEAFFKACRKLQRGIEHSQRRLEETLNEIDWLESLDFSLQEAGSAADIEAVAEECRSAGLLKTDDRYIKKGPPPKAIPHQALSPSGLQILWGRNNRQNDELSSRQLKQGDLWFHAHNCPGTHLLLKGCGPSESTDNQDLEFAASLAAGYSRAKDDSKVEVMVAEAKNVQKPKGAKPGLVRVNGYRTLVVKPRRIDDQ